MTESSSTGQSLADELRRAAHPQVSAKARGLKILVFDIETAPHIAHVWGLFKQNIGLNQLQEPGRVLGFAYKWVGIKGTHWVDESENHEDMVLEAHRLFTEADVVVGYNSTPFDIPHMNREFILAGLTPPKPYKQIDLLKTVRKQFKFASGKLDHVCDVLGIGRKVKHEGHDLWTKCMAGDLKAWARMGRYARQDVNLTEKLLGFLLPWLSTVPHLGQLAGIDNACWACASDKLRRDGIANAFVTSYPLYQCQTCGAWNRLTNKLQHVTKTRQVRA